MRGLRLGLGLGGRAGGGAAPPVPDFYVDSVNGSDSNDGLTPETAFATMSRLDTELASDLTLNVAIARGSRLAPLTSPRNDVTGAWTAYGTGDMPFIDCSLPVTSGDIAPHGTHANVYVVEIAHAVAVDYSGTPKSSNGPHVGLWWETASTGMLGEYLVPTFGLADTATAEAFVRDNPGTVFVQKVGSSLTDVRNETTGSTLRYTFHLADSSDPRSGGTLRYACYKDSGLRFAGGATVNGIAFGRNMKKDCLSANQAGANPSAALPTFTNCAWLDPGCHGIVGPSNWRSCIAYSRTPGSLAAGGGWNNFATVLETREPDCQDSYFRGFNLPVYLHGSGSSLSAVTGRRLIFEDSNICLSLPTDGSMVSPGLFEDIRIIRCNGITEGPQTVRRVSALLKPAKGTVNTIAGTFGSTIEDAVIGRDGSETTYVSGMNLGTVNDTTVSARGTWVLRRVTLAFEMREWNLVRSHHQFTNVTIEDSVGVGPIVWTSDTAATTFLTKAVVTGSQFGPGTPSAATFANLAAMQVAMPDVASDCIMWLRSENPTFAGDATLDPTITGPANIVALGAGVNPSIITTLLGTTLNSVPTLASMGLTP